MTEEETIAKLDAIETDQERAHIQADRILQEFVPPAVREAYRRVEKRVDGFWYA